MKSKADNVLHELLSWLPCACGDLAGNESEADTMYNSPEVVGDLIGDHIYDECRGDRNLMVEVARLALDSKFVHSALKEAFLEKGAVWENLCRQE
jgi:hypothetical protein